MDIRDVEAVNVNGPPDTLAQLYQVIIIVNKTHIVVFVIVICICLEELVGVVGAAQAHLFYSSRQAEKLKGPSLQCFASQGGSKNCRRQQMLRLLGSSECVASSGTCCDTCIGNVVPYGRLGLLVPFPVKQPKKQKAVRVISAALEEELRLTLLEERDSMLQRYQGFKIIGGSFLSDRTVADICELAPSLTSVTDLDKAPTLRPENKSTIFRVVVDVLSCVAHTNP